MIRGLLAKELRQHATTLLFLCLALVGGLFLITNNQSLKRAGGSGFEMVRLLEFTYVPLSCLMLGQILIASEFRQRTQLFLEGLPLPRWRMLAVKYSLGLAIMFFTVGLTLVVAWTHGQGTESMTPRFATLLALKSAGWVWFIYALCFAHAFLGRYRVPLGVVIFFTLTFLSSAGVRVSSFGPFALVDDRFAFERFILPQAALTTTALLALGLTGLGFSMGLVRDATVASLLAEKMSSRERAFVTFMVIAAVFTGGYLSDHYKTATPVQMPGAIEVQHGVVRVLASAAVDLPTVDETNALESLAPRVAGELSVLAVYLGCESFPPVFLVHRRELEPGEFSKGDLQSSQGVLVRVNVTAKGFKESALVAWLVRHTLIAQSGGFAERERNAWALDGASEWWPRRERTLAQWKKEAGAAMPATFSAADLRRWFTVRKQVGQDKASALAATGIAVLQQQYGTDACQRFLAGMFQKQRTADYRGWWQDVTHPAVAGLRDATGRSEQAFIDQWRKALEAGSTEP